MGVAPISCIGSTFGQHLRPKASNSNAATSGGETTPPMKELSGYGSDFFYISGSNLGNKALRIDYKAQHDRTYDGFFRKYL